MRQNKSLKISDKIFHDGEYEGGIPEDLFEEWKWFIS